MPPDSPSDREAQDYRQSRETMRLSGTTRFDVDAEVARILKPGSTLDDATLKSLDDHLVDRAMKYIDDQVAAGEITLPPEPTAWERHKLQIYDWIGLYLDPLDWIQGEDYSANRPKTLDERKAEMRAQLKEHVGVLPKSAGTLVNVEIRKGYPLSAAVAEEMYGTDYHSLSKPRQLFITSLVTVLHQQMGKAGVEPDNLPLGAKFEFNFGSGKVRYESPDGTFVTAPLTMEALAKAPVQRKTKEQLAELHAQITEESVARLRNVTPYDAFESLKAMGLWNYPNNGAGRQQFLKEFEGNNGHFRGGLESFVGAMNDRITDYGEKVEMDNLNTYWGSAQQNEAFKNAFLDLVVDDASSTRSARAEAAEREALEAQRVEAEAEAAREAEEAARLEAERKAAREAEVDAVDNATRVPAFMEDLSTIESDMAALKKAKKQLVRKATRNPEGAEDEYTQYLQDISDMRTRVQAMEAELSLLEESRGLEYSSLEQAQSRLSAVSETADADFDGLMEIQALFDEPEAA